MDAEQDKNQITDLDYYIWLLSDRKIKPEYWTQEKFIAYLEEIDYKSFQKYAEEQHERIMRKIQENYELELQHEIYLTFITLFKYKSKPLNSLTKEEFDQAYANFFHLPIDKYKSSIAEGEEALRKKYEDSKSSLTFEEFTEKEQQHFLESIAPSMQALFRETIEFLTQHSDNTDN